MPSKYKYIKSDGTPAYQIANDPWEAIRNAPGRDPHSGVEYIPDEPTPSPYQGELEESKVGRYKTQKEKSRLDDELSGNSKNYESYDKILERSYKEDRDARAAQTQALINALNTKFATIEAQDAETIDLMNRERRAANSLQGLSGSNVGAARTIKTSKEGAEIKKYTAEQKAANLAEIIKTAATRDSEEFLKLKEARIANAKDKLTAEQKLKESIRSKAMEELSALSSGYSWDEIQKANPNLITQYSKELGMNEIALKALFLREGEANWEKIKDVSSPGKQTFIYRNKATGEIKTEDIDTPEGYKFYASIGDNGAFINESTRDIQYIGGGSNPTSPTSNTPEVSWDQYLKQTEDILGMNLDPNGSTYKDLKAQYDQDIASKPSGSSEGATKFSASQKLRLEQAGLLNASRQEQLDFLYGSSDVGAGGP